MKLCEFCKKEYSSKSYYIHLKSKKHIKNKNKPDIKISKQNLKDVNIKLILFELIENENNDLEWTKEKIKNVLELI